jgi:hypothetical protein
LHAGEGRLRINLEILGKYFVHGVSFQIIMLFLTIGWSFVFVFLVAIGYILGLIAGIVLLLLIMGGLNSFLAGLIWNFRLKTGWKDVTLHGMLLIAGLLIINAIVVTAPFSIVDSALNGSFLNIGMRITTFIIAAFMDGFIAKNTAGLWKEGDEIQAERPAEPFFGTRMSPVK